MQNYYQGLMRCKDFIFFLRDKIEEHGWNIIDQDMDTARWFVVQKQAADGGIMTTGFKERQYPNYGDLRSVQSIALTAEKDGERFISPYDINLHRFINSTTNTYSTNNTLTINSTGDSKMNSSLLYFSTPVIDTEESVAHLYYIISFTEDGFFVKTRGNPTLAGSITNGSYFGAFDNLTNLPATNINNGCWGFAHWLTRFYCTRHPNTGISNNTFHGADNYDTALNFGYISGHGSYSDMLHCGSENYPITKVILGQGWQKQPMLTLPSDFMLFCGKKENFADENIFLEAHGNTYIYTSPYSEAYRPGILIKAIECVKNVSVLDTGTGYQIEWTNPTDSTITKVAIYAKASDYPQAYDDPDAILIYEDLNPTLGATSSFVDTDETRYGETMHYAVVAFDDNGSIPTPDVVPQSPHVSLIIKDSRAKISTSIIEITTHPTLFNPSYAAYRYTNNNKINAYYNPVAVYPLDDNTDNTTIAEVINNLHGTASANTVDMSVPGKLNNALNLAGNRYLTLPADPLLQFPNSFTVQAWIQRPTTFAQQDNAIFATADDRSEWRYTYFSAAPQTSLFWAKTGDSFSSYFPFPHEWTNMDLQFMTFQRQGADLHMFINGERLNVGNPTAGTVYTWNNLNAQTNIGSRSTTRYFNGIYDNFEFYPHPLSHLQIKYHYNGGTGRALSTADLVDGMAIIAAPNSIGERATYKLPETIDLRNVNNIALDCYSKIAGENFKVVFISADGSEFSASCNLTNAATWENLILDISATSNELKRHITKIAIEVLTAPDYNIVSIKNLTRA